MLNKHNLDKSIIKGFSASVLVMLIFCFMPALSNGSDLVLYFPFDEGSGNTAYDHSPYGHDGTIYGASWVAGMSGYALYFNGSSDYVRADHTSVLNVQAITITCWINMSEGMNSKYGSPVHKRGCYHIDMQNTRFCGNINTPGSPGDHWTYDGYLQINQWYFLTLTYVDGDSVRLFVDANQTAVRECSDVIAQSYFFDLFVGKRQEGDRHFEGMIDEVRIYDRALSYSEIVELYNSYFALQATVDIHPKTLNLKSQGMWVTCYIELPGGYSVEDIDLSTVAMTAIDDEPLDPPLYREGPTGIGDEDEDGIPDLMVKFDRQDLIAILAEMVEPPTDVKLTVSGELTDDTPFEGSDVIRVIHGREDTRVKFAAGPMTQRQTGVPTSFALKESEPNPFSAQTSIRYALPLNSHVRIEIMDVSGRVVAILLDDVMNAGYHTINWNGCDNTGKAVSSGVYFLRFKADDHKATEKLILLR